MNASMRFTAEAPRTQRAQRKTEIPPRPLRSLRLCGERLSPVPPGQARCARIPRMQADRHLRDELRERGYALATSLGVARDTGAALADMLMLQYNRWPRRYHDARHLLACVRAADEVRGLADDADTIAFALWFHDAVYWPWRHDNEARSAVQARDA